MKYEKGRDGESEPRPDTTQAQVDHESQCPLNRVQIPAYYRGRGSNKFREEFNYTRSREI